MTINASLACAVLAVVTVGAQTPAQKFKAIWEPVPFNRDVSLNALACVGPETCWVVGDKSTILFTENGGTTWQVQLGGDPESTDDSLSKVFFLDATHGWAMTTRGKILGTRDGRTWAELSTVSGTAKGVWFVNPQDGVEFESRASAIQRSADGGRTWTPGPACVVDASVGGLPRRLPCRLSDAHFISPTVGFAGGEAATSMGSYVAVFARTTDAGRTWTMSTIPEATRTITSVRFWSGTDGIIVLDRGEEVHWTADGGATWTRSVKQRQWPSAYGVGDGGFIVGVGESGGIGYSMDGGRNFTSRPLTLPARTNAVTFPDAQHGYLVGQHAMVYRYRIVPIDYKSQGMIAAMAPGR